MSDGIFDRRRLTDIRRLDRVTPLRGLADIAAGGIRYWVLAGQTTPLT
jgi:hypothetical protein